MLNVNISKIEIKTKAGPVRLINDLVFTLEPENIYIIVGKNGSGKTTLMKSLLNLHFKDDVSVTGSVEYLGTDLFTAPHDRLAELRKNELKFVMQESINTFDPLKKLKYYFEAFDCGNEIKNYLELFSLPSRSELEGLYPYELSGGMAQRLNMVFSLASKPRLLFMDEPTSHIDVFLINRLIGELIRYKTEDKGTLLAITHDIKFAVKICDKIGFIADSGFSGFFERESLISQTLGIKYSGFLDLLSREENE